MSHPGEKRVIYDLIDTEVVLLVPHLPQEEMEDGNMTNTKTEIRIDPGPGDRLRDTLHRLPHLVTDTENGAGLPEETEVVGIKRISLPTEEMMSGTITMTVIQAVIIQGVIITNLLVTQVEKKETLIEAGLKDLEITVKEK